MPTIPPRDRLTPDSLRDAIKANPSGGTLRFVGTDPLPDSGYFVALPVGGFCDALADIDQASLREFLNTVTPRCNPEFRDRLFVGWWAQPDTDLVDGEPVTETVLFIEPVIHIAFMPDAIRTATLLGQTHVYSIVRRESLAVADFDTCAPALI